MTTDISVSRDWPKTPSERRKEWERRERAFRGLDYTEAEQKRLGLFVGTDEDGRITHRTRRIMRDGAFVAQRAAMALANGLSIDLTDAAQKDLDADGDPTEGPAADLLRRARAVWARSGIEDHAQSWATAHAACGDSLFEVAMVEDGGAALIRHPMRTVELYYDPQGRTLVAVRIIFTYTGAPDDAGAAAEHTYERWLRPHEKRWRIDGGAWEVEPHNLGVVPAVHVQFAADGDPHIGLHAAYHIEDAQALADSAATQISAVGTQMGNPLLALIGATMEKGSDAGQIGRVFQLPPGADLRPVELAFTGLKALVEHTAQLRQQIADTSSAFLFVDAGASASGLALSYRAGAFKADVEPAQKRWWRALARGVAMCLALEDGRPYTEADDVFEVRGAPALPEDRAALADLLIKLDDAGLIVLEDAIRALQGAGVLPSDSSADEYAAEIRDERDRRAEADRATLAQLRGAGPVPPEVDEAEPVEDDEAPVEPPGADA